MSRVIALLGTGALLAAMPATAHHSFAMFDQKKIMTLEGTVHEFQWTNPHAFIELDVPGDGKTTRWSIELNSPNNLKRQGWNRTALKAGDKVTLRMSPLRDGHPGGLFLDVRLPNGKMLDSGLPKDGTPVNVPRL
jgi:NAD(P)H-flavin reductase